MKKSIISFLLLILLSNQAHARKSRVFIGLDALGSTAKHELYDKASDPFIGTGGPYDPPKQRDNSNFSVGVGASIGYYAYLKKLYVAPELFFDYLDSKTADFYKAQHPAYNADEMVVNYRYGFKMNVGYNFYRGLSAYVNAGITNVNFVFRFRNAQTPQERGSQVSYGSSKVVPIIGGGLAYDINPHLTFRLGYDHQTFEARYVFNGLADRIEIGTYRAGITANF